MCVCVSVSVCMSVFCMLCAVCCVLYAGIVYNISFHFIQIFTMNITVIPLVTNSPVSCPCAVCAMCAVCAVCAVCCSCCGQDQTPKSLFLSKEILKTTTQNYEY